MWNNLGMAYEHLDRLDDAREAYGKAIELQNERAGISLARLDGVETIIKTAKVETETASQ
jgi:tetratricopeptide (TPR) repeat protein